MNVIFLDVDGVLNGYHSSMKNLKKTNSVNIDIEKIKILSIICKELNASIVLSSSWKLGKDILLVDQDRFGMAHYLEYLLFLFKEHDINFLGFTPNIKKIRGCSIQEMWKEDDIRYYLWNHPKVEHFCILDDDTFDLNKLLDYVVKTKYYSEESKDEGLKIEHLDEMKRILSLEHKYKRDKLK